ncbi:hypothetical protein DEV91_10643 [Phyllobacterium brassicacearum]|nr:hypothetical protein DEV91_10643 [Phyllobacterium brassicacearum]
MSGCVAFGANGWQRTESSRSCVRRSSVLNAVWLRLSASPALAADMERPAAAFTAGEIDSLLGGGTETVDARKEAKAVLRARQHVWDGMDERLEYSRAIRAEAEADVNVGSDGGTSEGSLSVSASRVRPRRLGKSYAYTFVVALGEKLYSCPFKDRLNGVQICGGDGGRRVLRFRAAYRRNADNRRTGKVFRTPANKSPRCSYLGSINSFHFFRFFSLNVFHSYDTKRLTLIREARL